MGVVWVRVAALVAMSTDRKDGSGAGAGANADPGAGSDSEQEPSPQEHIDATVWRVLRDVVLAGICTQIGKRPHQLTLEEQNNLLEPMVTTLVGAHEMLRECGNQYLVLGLEQARGAIHRAAGVDHEMLDEAAEFYAGQGGRAWEDTPLILER
jgi:hypothetical protein